MPVQVDRSSEAQMTIGRPTGPSMSNEATPSLTVAKTAGTPVDTTGDGIIAGLQVLAALRQQGKKLEDMCADLVFYPQKLVNVPIKPGFAWADSEAIAAAVTRNMATWYLIGLAFGSRPPCQLKGSRLSQIVATKTEEERPKQMPANAFR